MNALPIIAYASWILSEVYLNRFARSGNIEKQRKDNGSEWMLWLSAIGSVTLASIISIYSSASITSNETLFYLPPIIMVAGIIFRFAAVRQLGKFFTVDVVLQKDHQLIQTGLYKYVRHPSYTGALITFTGFGLSLNHWISFVLVFSSAIISFNIRMNLEENALISLFGDTYRDYKNRTWKVLPFVL
jgi:protein-S-isoprenylcysteine O-methyltransferase Ste14